MDKVLASIWLILVLIAMLVWGTFVFGWLLWLVLGVFAGCLITVIAWCIVIEDY